MFRRPARLTPLGLNRRMRENRLSGGVGGVTGNSRHPDPIGEESFGLAGFVLIILAEIVQLTA